ncbi:excinuclease ABC subunit UvrC [Limibaculum sp. M0105]|uniref:UvrABC system protein C n=1 Tax=Thermohalobaculum xanthum TaxID=2753746 RepID=A0A8J7M9F5_9RHOB|nr:excinuclease ABC subunit UvrC [Thermohalobaculum xanthum]MBK0400769.1 excinuclease ABC subunit UvrC [Thermohalobaculum xanthum]
MTPKNTTHAEAAETGIETGPEVIRRHLATLDDRPGVYRMLSARSEVLYVGKARALRRRVASYAKMGGHTNRIARMISETASMEFITTETETEALLLEANLIKQLKPRYNVLLRDDKSFPYILIEDGAFPLLTKHRGAQRAKGHYFGPFASAGAVNRALNQMERAFLLRTCSDTMFRSRTRPCLLFQIKRCSGPCTGEISAEDYALLVEDAVAFLRGRTTRIQAELAERMRTAAADMDFERAAIFRDRIRAMAHVQGHQGINPRLTAEADVFALHREGGQACVQVFFFRNHQNWGNHAFFPKVSPEMDDAEVMESFIGQFYSAMRVPPRMVLMSHPVENGDMLSGALRALAGRRVAMAVPRRGEKRELVDHALTNAREALGRRMAETASHARNLEGVAEAFGLTAPPQRIEVYDNSHLMGTDAVGAMIVAGPDGFERGQYRKFTIKGGDLTPGDDFGMMREVLTRRFGKLMRDDPERQTGAWPDLILIDGGQGQVSAAGSVLADLGVIDVALVGVAKGVDRDAGKEIFHAPGRRPFALPYRSATLYFLQRLRDEAHRFAIGAHRAKRAKATTRTPLDDIPGVGPARKRALLTHFGSAKAVSRAGLTDLKAVEGVSDAMAETIYAFFHGER